MSGVERKRSIPTLTEGDLVYDNNQSKAELFAKAFASVSSNSNLTTEFLTRRATFEQQHSQPVAPSGESIGTTTDDDANNTPFEFHELREGLRQCKKNRSSGDDRLTYELLKEVPKKSHGTILKFFNNIWQRGQLTPDWKKAIVVPVLKPNKSAFETRTCRPIALTSVLCKLIE